MKGFEVLPISHRSLRFLQRHDMLCQSCSLASPLLFVDVSLLCFLTYLLLVQQVFPISSFLLLHSGSLMFSLLKVKQFICQD